MSAIAVTRTSMDDALLPTELVWNPRVVRPGGRGALVGTLLGVPVRGMDRGRGVAYQIAMIDGEVRTVWWDGHLWGGGEPGLIDVDTGEQVRYNPMAVAWFARLDSLG